MEEGIEKEQRVVFEETRLSDFSIFMPKSSSAIFSDYPELKSYQEFNSITESDMLFVWYYACQASPLFKVRSDSQRAKYASEAAYKRGSKKEFDKRKIANIEAGNWGDKIGDAIQRMKSFRIGPRIRALQVLEKGFENLEKIINMDASDPELFKNASGEQDFAKYKAFVDCVDKATKLMPDLIKQIESGFSVIRKEEEEAEYEMSFLDTWHQEND